MTVGRGLPHCTVCTRCGLASARRRGALPAVTLRIRPSPRPETLSTARPRVTGRGNRCRPPSPAAAAAAARATRWSPSPSQQLRPESLGLARLPSLTVAAAPVTPSRRGPPSSSLVAARVSEVPKLLAAARRTVRLTCRGPSLAAARVSRRHGGRSSLAKYALGSRGIVAPVAGFIRCSGCSGQASEPRQCPAATTVARPQAWPYLLVTARYYGPGSIQTQWRPCQWSLSPSRPPPGFNEPGRQGRAAWPPTCRASLAAAQ